MVNVGGETEIAGSGGTNIMQSIGIIKNGTVAVISGEIFGKPSRFPQNKNHCLTQYKSSTIRIIS